MKKEKKEKLVFNNGRESMWVCCRRDLLGHVKEMPHKMVLEVKQQKEGIEGAIWVTSIMMLMLLYSQRRHAHGPFASPFPISISLIYHLLSF